jgi:hypothetical protein
MRKRPRPLETAALRTVELSERPSKVSIRQFSTPFSTRATMSEFLEALPNMLAARDIRDLGRLIASAGRAGKEILAMCGGHVVKTGLAPLIIRLMRERLVTAVAVNGAVAVHDAEIAMIGATSEEVTSALDVGMFGVARETAEVLNRAAEWAWRERRGLGEGLGHILHEMRPPHGEQSLLLQAHEMGTPVTVHVALGTDVVHQHPSALGEAIGAASLFDFRLLAAVVSRMEEGVVVNIGSAVVLPEVFVKALNLARNLGHRVERFTAADFDFIRQYRPGVNVVGRPTAQGGRGFTLTGHHELLIPLLYASVMVAFEQDPCDNGVTPNATR